MKFSAKVEYALRALLELSEEQGKGPLGAKEIASRQGIPERFLEQQMNSLAKAGFVRSQRGAQGGCMLSRDPDKISVLEVIEALEGPLLNMECLDSHKESNYQCSHKSLCVLQEVWSESQQKLREYLSSVTIADLWRRQREMTQAADTVSYI